MSAVDRTDGPDTEPTHLALTLQSGALCRVWLHPEWAVLEANGLVTHCRRKHGSDHRPDPQSDVRGYAAALLEATR